MNESATSKRSYRSARRTSEAAATRERILKCARALFGEHGIDRVTVAQIASAACVSNSTIYTSFTSKAGILHALMETALFGERYQAAIGSLQLNQGSIDQIRATARIARAIHEGEADELGLLRGASAFSPSLRALEQAFEEKRYDMQRERIERLFHDGNGNADLTVEEARRVLWTLTSREIFHKLVVDAGWSAKRYEAWLEKALIGSLVASDAA